MKRISPPKLAEKILSALSPSGKTGILGDMEEEYRLILSQKGRFRADLWYAWQIFRPLPFLTLSTISWSFEMLKNYWISFFRILKRHRLYSFINIFGLAVGLVCFILISLWIYFETSYDQFHANSDNLYQVINRIHLPSGDLRFFANTPGALAETLKIERPEIKNVSRYVDGTEILLGTKDKRFLENVSFVDPAFLEMFSFEFLEGTPQTALSQPDSIVLTENTAKKYFSGKDVLGQEIFFGSNKNLLVTGVIKEFPENSFLHSLPMVPISALRDQGWKTEAWGGGNYETYVHLKGDVDLDHFNAQIRDTYKKHAANWETSKLSLRPITKIHLYELNGGGPIVYVYIFTGMTFFILLMAIINFTNLSTARSTLRAKEISARKMIGASRRQLMKQILVESIMVALVSGGLAVAAAFLLLPVLNQLTGNQITFSLSVGMILFLTGIVLLTGILSGIYPAFILSSMKPVQAYQGGRGTGKNKLPLRKGLITFQFSLSIFMIIAMIGVKKQLDYLNTRDLGYNRDNIVSLGLAEEINEKYSIVRNELLRNPEIHSLTRSSCRLDRANTTTGDNAITWEGQSGGIQMPRTHLMRVDPEFIDTFKIDMVKGRFFSHKFPKDRKESVVINETAWKTMDLKSPIGKRMTVWNRHFRIIGIIKDFHFYSLHEEIQPLVLINRYAGFNTIFIRINSQNLKGTVNFIHNKLKEIAPGYIPDLTFLHKGLKDIYIMERRLEKLTKYFSALAIFISCIGLLGLISFSIRQKTREIAIRKVLGASEGDVVLQLIKETLICVIAANIIIYPVAYYTLHSWLQNYAYHTTLGISIFILASSLALALALLSVGWNVVKASLANPVDSLRWE
jgi:putative ABC transport system permease protein